MGQSKILEGQWFSKHDLEHIGGGGEHMVYEISGREGIVVKVNTYVLMEILGYQRTYGIPLGSYGEETQTLAEAHIKKERERMTRFIDFFGRDHILVQRKFMMQAPMTDELKEKIRRRIKTHIELPEEAWTSVTIQRRLHALDDPDTLCIKAGYAEWTNGKFKHLDPTQKEIYQSVNASLIYSEGRVDMGDFLLVQGNDALKALIGAAVKDTQLMQSLKEAISACIRYTTETGEVLDLAGPMNMIFFQEPNSEWQWSMPDALYPGSLNRDNEVYYVAQEAIRKQTMGTPLTSGEKNVVMNVINYVRTINGLADFCGIVERLNLIPVDANDEPHIDFYDLITSVN